MTAMASGCSICEPAPKREGQRQHPADGGQSGHDDGAQAALRRVQHGLARRSALGAEALVGVEQQNAVFGHDADDHDESHERSHVERGAR